MADILEQDYITRQRTMKYDDFLEETETGDDSFRTFKDTGYRVFKIENTMNSYLGERQVVVTYAIPITAVETEKEDVEIRRVSFGDENEYAEELEAAGVEIINRRKVYVNDKATIKTLIEFELKTKAAPVQPGVPSIKPAPIDLGFMAWFSDLFRGHSSTKSTFAAPASSKKLSDVVSQAKLARFQKAFKGGR